MAHVVGLCFSFDFARAINRICPPIFALSHVPAVVRDPRGTAGIVVLVTCGFLLCVGGHERRSFFKPVHAHGFDAHVLHARKGAACVYHRHPEWGGFVKAFNGIARHRHRYEAFKDFVPMAAISLHNAIHRDEKLEAEYLTIVKRYSHDEVNEFCGLLGRLVVLLDVEFQDVLGPLYMELDLGNTNTGQFFTPHEVSELMAI